MISMPMVWAGEVLSAPTISSDMSMVRLLIRGELLPAGIISNIYERTVDSAVIMEYK